MFERAVIGVDPGVASTGVAVVGVRRRGGAGVVEASTVRTSAGEPEASRLSAVFRAVSEAIRRHAPESLAIERLMWNRNVGSAMSVARASGVVLLAAAEAGIPVHEYGPLEVKMAVAGNGTAAKAEVRRALERLHRVADLPPQADATDAVAVAVCHLHRRPSLREAGTR